MKSFPQRSVDIWNGLDKEVVQVKLKGFKDLRESWIKVDMETGHYLPGLLTWLATPNYTHGSSISDK